MKTKTVERMLRRRHHTAVARHWQTILRDTPPTPDTCWANVSLKKKPVLPDGVRLTITREHDLVGSRETGREYIAQVPGVFTYVRSEIDPLEPPEYDMDKRNGILLGLGLESLVADEPSEFYTTP